MLLKVINRLHWLVSKSWAMRPRCRYRKISSFTDVYQSFSDETSRYWYFRWYYKWKLPQIVKRHRQYFSEPGRGFGEDAFHAMWFLLFQEYRPRRLLEIGVYRGQTISLFSLLGEYFSYTPEVVGLSPLSSESDSVSAYPELNYEVDIEDHFRALQLKSATIVRATSQSDLGRQTVGRNQGWDLVYIDGSHDLDDVRFDAENVARNLKRGGILVMDDCSLYAPFTAPRDSFSGHHGPSTVVLGLAFKNKFFEIGTCGHNRVFVRV